VAAELATAPLALPQGSSLFGGEIWRARGWPASCRLHEEPSLQSAAWRV